MGNEANTVPSPVFDGNRSETVGGVGLAGLNLFPESERMIKN
jgi:hypothetical protein